jgi:hypothetical protein
MDEIRKRHPDWVIREANGGGSKYWAVPRSQEFYFRVSGKGDVWRGDDLQELERFLADRSSE